MRRDGKVFMVREPVWWLITVTGSVVFAVALAACAAILWRACLIVTTSELHIDDGGSVGCVCRCEPPTEATDAR